MSAILNFTEAAIQYIRGMIAQAQGLGFRVTIKKTGCSGYSYEPRVISTLVAGDLHFMAQQDLKVYVDPLAVDYIKGLTVDFIEEKKEGSLKQKRLVFINPNEKSRCGCGESFHV